MKIIFTHDLQILILIVYHGGFMMTIVGVCPVHLMNGEQCQVSTDSQPGLPVHCYWHNHYGVMSYPVPDIAACRLWVLRLCYLPNHLFMCSGVGISPGAR